MDHIKNYLQSYLILLLVMRIVVYLIPQEKNQIFLRRIVGLWMTLLLLAPILTLLKKPDVSVVYEQMESMERRMENQKFEGEEGTIFELFEGEKTVGENQ